MKKNSPFINISLSFALLVPFQGRLAYGIILLIMLNTVMAAATASRKIVSITGLNGLHEVITGLVVISTTLILRSMLVLYSPAIALTLGNAVYLTGVCSYFVSALYKKECVSLKDELKFNLRKTGLWSIYGFCFFLFRDIIAFGTVSFPCPSGIFEFTLMPEASRIFFAGTFFATIPGAVILVALTHSVHSFLIDRTTFFRLREAHNAL